MREIVFRLVLVRFPINGLKQLNLIFMSDGAKTRKQEILQFHRELADLCLKFDIAGLAGVWFGCDEEMGRLEFADVGDLRMKFLIPVIARKWENFLSDHDIKQGPPTSVIHETRGIAGDAENN
jgi:hypothetical protein